MLMKKPLLLLGLSCLITVNAGAQAINDYRSAATGNWSTRATWERYDGSSWLTPTAAQGTPNNTDGVITILNPHTVTVTANVSIDQTVVDLGGTLRTTGGTLTIANGTGTDLTVNGSFINAGGTITTTGTLAISDGGTYQHARNGNTVPTATWSSGSTCLVTGVTNTVPNGLGQSFHHFTWNCTGQSAHVDANALATINGDLTVQSTGAAGTNRLNNTGGDITVAGSYVQTGGTFNPGAGAVTQIFRVGGNFNQTAGTFRNNTAGGLVIVQFSGAGKTFRADGTIQNIIDWNIRPGATITLNSNIPVNASATLRDSGTLQTGGYIATGAGSFTLPDGGTLGIGSADGITALGTAAGSVQTTTARNYSTAASYIYNGSAAQATGSGLPATVSSLTIDNASGVTLTNSCTANGTLLLNNGVLATGSNTMTVGSAGTAQRGSGWVNGPLKQYIATGASYASKKMFHVGSTAQYSPDSLAFKNVTSAGYATCQAFRAAGGYSNAGSPAAAAQRYWRFAKDGTFAFDECKATLWYTAADFNTGFIEASDEPNEVVGSYDPLGKGKWFFYTRAVDAGNNNVEITGLTSARFEQDLTFGKDVISLSGTLGTDQPDRDPTPAFGLFRCSPDPANGPVEFSFDLPKAERVQLEIFNMLGERVRELLDKDLPAGRHTVRWNLTGQSNRKLAAGLYIYRLQTGTNAAMRKMTIIR